MADCEGSVSTEPRRKGRLGLLIGLALLASGAGAWLLGRPPDPLPPHLAGENLPVNASARDRRDVSANNSPALASNPVDPANLVVANRIDLPMYSCALHVTADGGSSWADTPVPFPAGEEEPARCYAPDVAFSPDGTLHLAFVTLKGTGNVPNAVWMLSSADGGRTLGLPVKASGPLAFQVQLTADPARADRLHLTWLQAEGTGTLLFPTTNNPIVTATSDDGGATWSQPQRVSASGRGRVVAPAPALGPKGQRYVLYLDLLDDRLDYGGAHQGIGGDPYAGPWALVLARSTDQGATWQETVIDGALVPTERVVVFIPPTPSLAIDHRSGRIYATFTTGRLGDADVELWTSSDGGRIFGAPVRVNDTPAHDGTSQYMPHVGVAPDGRVDVVYYDRRADQANRQNEMSLQSSFDHGRTFAHRVRVSDRSFDSQIGPGSDHNLPDLGTRLALLSTRRRALAVWPDTRSGSVLTSKQDLASAVLEIPQPASASHRWLRGVAAAAATLGLAALALGLRGRRRSGPRGAESRLSDARRSLPEPRRPAAPTVEKPASSKQKSGSQLHGLPPPDPLPPGQASQLQPGEGAFRVAPIPEEAPAPIGQPPTPRRSEGGQPPSESPGQEPPALG